MFVRKQLGAALLDRNTACASLPPGSDGWNSWKCGASAPIQVMTPSISYTRPDQQSPPAPAPAVIVTVDNAAAQRAEQEYNERLRAQMAQADAERAKSVADQAAAKAQREADILRAQSNSGPLDWEGSAGYSNSGVSAKVRAPQDSKTSLYLLAAAVVAVGLIAASKKK